MLDYQTASIRYTSFSRFLSGVTLYPSGGGVTCDSRFFDLNPALYAGVLDERGLMAIFEDLGMTSVWAEQGFHKVWVQFECREGNCHILSVFCEVDGRAELLLHAILWLEYTRFEDAGVVLPTVCVEHLRLQNPSVELRQGEGLPGQDYPSSGLFRRAYRLAQFIASKTGALCITEVPEYFHTAWMFREYFRYVDGEMQGYYHRLVKDLAGGAKEFKAVAELSRALEAGRVLKDGQRWSWPTEMQVCVLCRGVDVCGAERDVGARFEIG